MHIAGLLSLSRNGNSLPWMANYILDLGDFKMRFGVYYGL